MGSLLLLNVYTRMIIIRQKFLHMTFEKEITYCLFKQVMMTQKTTENLSSFNKFIFNFIAFPKENIH